METLAREEGHPSHGLSGRVNVAGRQENKTVWDGGEGFWEGRKGQPEEEENELGGEESENEESEEECEEEREYYGSEDEYYQEGEQPVDGSRMLWLCAICNITVNAFTRNEHIASRSHINASQPTFIELMQCGPLCDEEMPVFLRTDHQLEEEHPRMSQKQWDGDEGRLLALDMPTTPDGDDNGGIRFDETVESYITWPDTPSSPSSSSLYYKLRGTFYCNICAGEFDIFTEGLHSDDGQTWDCALCQKTMHRAVQGMHLLSEQHTKMMDIYETYPASFHCEYCERSYLPADRESHLGGMEHEQMVAQHELAQRYWQRMDELNVTNDEDGADRYFVPSNFFCEICSGVFPLASRDAHVRSDKHMRLKEWRDSQQSSGVGKLKKKKEEKKDKGQTSTQKRLSLPSDAEYCSVCDRWKSAAGMTGHIKGGKHRKKANAQQQAGRQQPAPRVQAAAPTSFSDLPYVTILGAKFHCGACYRERHVVGIEGHLNSHKHRRNVAAMLK